MNKALEELRRVLDDKHENLNSTAKVLTLPSGVTREVASQAIEALNLAPVLRDVGLMLAREISDELERMALRPADYADLPDMPQLVAARLGAELSKAPTEFVEALLEQMRLRG